MRAASDLHRSVARITLDVHRQMKVREQATRNYRLCEREQQFQGDISGQLGPVPAESTVKILFEIMFLGDAGVARSSQLDEPLFRGGVKLTSAPAGTIPYAYVSDWILDPDFNFIGAYVIAGAHNPVVAATPATTVIDSSFRGVLHCGFQGYGAPRDPDGDGVGGGMTGQP